MRIYIAGPMRGKDQWNFTLFDEAAARWRKVGWDVFNPADQIRQFKFPTPPDGLTDDNRRRVIIVLDTNALAGCGALALLPGWEGSHGATMELAAAQFIGLDIYDAVTMGRAPPPPLAYKELQVLRNELSLAHKELEATRKLLDQTYRSEERLAAEMKKWKDRYEQAARPGPDYPGVGHSY